MWRRLWIAWACIAALCAAGTASAASGEPAKPHQGTSEFSAALNVCANSLVTLQVHTGKGGLPTARTSDVPDAARGGGEMVSLYRAVGDAELKVIQSSGGRIPASLSGLESKYFSATAEGAASYARQAVRGFGDAPYTLIETQVARSSLPSQVLLQVDRNVPAVVLPNTYLPSLGPAQAWTYMPIP